MLVSKRVFKQLEDFSQVLFTPEDLTMSPKSSLVHLGSDSSGLYIYLPCKWKYLPITNCCLQKASQQRR
jgi:hypothetical protein